MMKKRSTKKMPEAIEEFAPTRAPMSGKQTVVLVLLAVIVLIAGILATIGFGLIAGAKYV